MAVLFGNTANGNANAATSITVSFNPFAAGGDRDNPPYILGLLSLQLLGVTTSVTHSAANMTSISVENGTSVRRTEIWGHHAPVAGASNMVANFATSDVVLGCHSAFGVNREAPIGLAFGKNGTTVGSNEVISFQLPGIEGGMTVDVLCTGGTPSTPNQTQNYTNLAPTNLSAASQRLTPTHDSGATFQWTINTIGSIWAWDGVTLMPQPRRR